MQKKCQVKHLRAILILSYFQGKTSLSDSQVVLSVPHGWMQSFMSLCPQHIYLQCVICQNHNWLCDLSLPIFDVNKGCTCSWMVAFTFSRTLRVADNRHSDHNPNVSIQIRTTNGLSIQSIVGHTLLFTFLDNIYFSRGLRFDITSQFSLNYFWLVILLRMAFSGHLSEHMIGAHSHNFIMLMWKWHLDLAPYCE